MFKESTGRTCGCLQSVQEEGRHSTFGHLRIDKRVAAHLRCRWSIFFAFTLYKIGRVFSRACGHAFVAVGHPCGRVAHWCVDVLAPAGDFSRACLFAGLETFKVVLVATTATVREERALACVRIERPSVDGRPFMWA
jgi:hypothetical protein